ncbi:MAG: RluA family pseudouridine synthase, partial [Cyanobacteria bacterium P01_F01_bin.4]
MITLSVQTHAPERLDRWLATAVETLSRSRIQKLIEQGAVTLNGQPCPHKKILVSPGDQIELTLPPIEPLALKPEAIPLEILYEDDTLIIVNKSAGMVVHPAPGHPSGTLVNAILAHCGDQLTGVGGVQRPGIVHRLDKDTTGAMVVAKTEAALHHLQGQIQAKTARREYLGVVYGAPKTEAGTVNQPIGRHPKDRKKQAIIPESKGGRVAITHWRVKERLGNYILMHYQLETGRTHQIRVHSAHMGHPIVGDPQYGSGRSVGVNLSGQGRQAGRLTRSHPRSRGAIFWIAPGPPTFVNSLQRLGPRG